MFESIQPLTATPQELEKINRYTRSPLAQKDVYVFRLLLCDNEVDREFERFDSAALPKLAELFIGKTGLFDHSMQTKNQTARIYDTQVETDESRVTQGGEAYCCIRAKAYMPRTQKNADLIDEIEAGIKKETSVGCAVGNVTCSVCGASVRKGQCSHIRGRRYDGKLCHAVLRDPSDAYEWSFVAVPAQREAGVTKACHFVQNAQDTRDGDELQKTLRAAQGGLSLSETQRLTLLGCLEQAEQIQKAQKEWLSDLQTETVRLGTLCLPGMEKAALEGICAQLDHTQLKALKSAFAQNGRQFLPGTVLRPQLCRQSHTQTDTAQANDEFKI